MKALGDQFLARAALADHQHRPAHRRGTARAFYRVEERARLADELIFPLHDQLIADFPICWQYSPHRRLPTSRLVQDFPSFSLFGTLLAEWFASNEPGRDEDHV